MHLTEKLRGSSNGVRFFVLTYLPTTDWFCPIENFGYKYHASLELKNYSDDLLLYMNHETTEPNFFLRRGLFFFFSESYVLPI